MNFDPEAVVAAIVLGTICGMAMAVLVHLFCRL